MSLLGAISRREGYRPSAWISYTIIIGLTIALTGCGGGGGTSGISSAGNTAAAIAGQDSRSTLVAAQSRSFTPNYAAELTPQARWGTNTLRVYVPNAADIPVAQQAMQRWENSTGGLFHFSLASQSDKPQITFSRVSQSEFTGNVIGRTDFTYDATSNTMTSATIQISQDLDDAQEAAVAVHELGHALGIQGHSDNKSDIMYPTVSDDSNISERDLNTLFWIYRDGPVAASSRAVGNLISVTVECPRGEY